MYSTRMYTIFAAGKGRGIEQGVRHDWGLNTNSTCLIQYCILQLAHAHFRLLSVSLYVIISDFFYEQAYSVYAHVHVHGISFCECGISLHQQFNCLPPIQILHDCQLIHRLLQGEEENQRCRYCDICWI